MAGRRQRALVAGNPSIPTSYSCALFLWHRIPHIIFFLIRCGAIVYWLVTRMSVYPSSSELPPCTVIQYFLRPDIQCIIFEYLGPRQNVIDVDFSLPLPMHTGIKPIGVHGACGIKRDWLGEEKT